ncbi:MAG: Lytic transglycosylase [Hyphomicrobiales bacterium]|nr:Lytic transglycosylase [Hyphomicrobiales bacterium]
MTLPNNALRTVAGLGALGLLAFFFVPTERPTAPDAASNATPADPSSAAQPAPPPARTEVAAVPKPVLDLSKPEPKAARAPDNPLAAIAEVTHPPQGGTPPRERGDVVAYAPDVPAAPGGNPVLRDAPPVNLEIDGLREAIAAYRSNDAAKGDAEASRIKEPLARTAAEWVAIQTLGKDAGFQRVSAFMKDQPDWPARASLERRLELMLYADKARPALTRAWFADREPQTLSGKIALARARIAAGEIRPAKKLVVDVWRNDDMTTWLEGQILREFGEILTRDDHRFRAARLAHDRKSAAALRAAALVDDGMTALVRARMAVDREAASDKLMKAVPAALQKDPLYLLADLQLLRRANKLDEAVKAMAEAPRDPALLVDADSWWTERRLLARKLLDAKRHDDAYAVASGHSAKEGEAAIEAEFHAGWIALRFIKDAERALPHFRKAAQFAQTPISRARTAYWVARAEEARGDKDAAEKAYRVAAEHPIAYYGQLAAAHLRASPAELRRPAKIARGDERTAAIRVVELLQALDQKDLAQTLAVETTRALDDEAQMAALADVVARSGDARATLVIGKLATQRGHTVDETAFPTFGIPAFEPFGGSAALPVVYSIARQESAFAPKVVSHAGAKGLMQMIDSTARMTAKQMGVEFDKSRLTEDPAFNAQLGAAHLGHLLAQYRGSYILTFVAYNAGPRRVKEWIEAYGDPRDPDVDPIDWVERIPFTETRNYVQRVIENLEMYKIRFGETKAFAIEADLRGARERL